MPIVAYIHRYIAKYNVTQYSFLNPCPPPVSLQPAQQLHFEVPHLHSCKKLKNLDNCVSWLPLGLDRL